SREWQWQRRRADALRRARAFLSLQVAFLPIEFFRLSGLPAGTGRGIPISILVRYALWCGTVLLSGAQHDRGDLAAIVDFAAVGRLPIGKEALLILIGAVAERVDRADTACFK